MTKKFNDTGTCIPARHYMVDTSNKIDKILTLIDDGLYFTINRPRQFGKTTTISLLYKKIRLNPAYLTIRLSFEGIGDAMFESKEMFCDRFASYLKGELERADPAFAGFLEYNKAKNTGFDYLSDMITNFVKAVSKKVVIIIDEVDKSSNNQLFMHFLGLLRDKYLKQNEELDYTFHSVVLAGVHDVKSLKMKLRPDAESKLNSPWNIAADFTIDMSFNPSEIATMLQEYSEDKGIAMDIPAMANHIYYYTSGYPYLVSKMCKVIDEILIPEKKVASWDVGAIDASFRYLTNKSYSTTLFDDMAKNIENNTELYNLVQNISINGFMQQHAITNPLVNLGVVYGILKEKNNFSVIHNLVFEQRLFDHFLSKPSIADHTTLDIKSAFISDEGLNMNYILIRFQQFLKENSYASDLKFLEQQGRLLFLSFLRPIINGKGYDFKESNTSDERRLDIVITYTDKRYILELKRWEGESYHRKGLQQLSDYLDIYSQKQGFLLIFDFRKEKIYKDELIQFGDKQIFAVWV